MPLKSGLEAEGEIMTTGVAPAPYSRAAASVVPEERWPITATTAGSAYSWAAIRTATSSLPESSATRSSSRRPRRPPLALIWLTDRKSTRLNSSHSQISYAVFCLKKKKRQSMVALCSRAQLSKVGSELSWEIIGGGQKDRRSV